jgi:inhibitor of cysteine peptidase
MILRKWPRDRCRFFWMVFFCCAIALNAKTILLDESDNATRVVLNAGDTLSVKLKSNMTTGFRWSVASAPSCIQQVAAEKESKINAHVGEPGFQTFVFKATGTCDARLRLNYFRPFEKDTPPAKAFWVDVSVLADAAKQDTSSQ